MSDWAEVVEGNGKYFDVENKASGLHTRRKSEFQVRRIGFLGSCEELRVHPSHLHKTWLVWNIHCGEIICYLSRVISSMLLLASAVNNTLFKSAYFRGAFFRSQTLKSASDKAALLREERVSAVFGEVVKIEKDHKLIKFDACDVTSACRSFYNKSLLKTIIL